MLPNVSQSLRLIPPELYYNGSHLPSIASFRHEKCDFVTWIFGPHLSHER